MDKSATCEVESAPDPGRVHRVPDTGRVAGHLEASFLKPQAPPISRTKGIGSGYLSVTEGTGWRSLVQVTSGGGEPWASQSRVTSSPALAVTLRGSSASRDPFPRILGLAVGGSTRGL